MGRGRSPLLATPPPSCQALPSFAPPFRLRRSWRRRLLLPVSIGHTGDSEVRGGTRPLGCTHKEGVGRAGSGERTRGEGCSWRGSSRQAGGLAGREPGRAPRRRRRRRRRRSSSSSSSSGSSSSGSGSPQSGFCRAAAAAPVSLLLPSGARVPGPSLPLQLPRPPAAARALKEKKTVFNLELGQSRAKTADRPRVGKGRALCCGLNWWGETARGAGRGGGVCGWEVFWGAGGQGREWGAAKMMAECGGGGGGGGPRKKALSLLEAARSRYESLQISDDVFGESGQDSSGNPFYSTSADSRSSSAASSEDEDEATTSSISSSSAAAAPPQPPAPEVEAAPEGPARGGGVCCFQGGAARRGQRAGAAADGRRQPPQLQLPAPMDEEDEEERGGWTQTLRDTPPPRFEDTSGPTRKMPPSSSAMDFFQLFVPDNVLKNMVVQTNMYAKKYQERFGSDGAWAEVTLTEMKAFLGYMISTSIYHCESVLSIWSSGFYSNKSIALVMSQSRFEKILKYFHVVAFRSSQTTHGLYKIQPFLDSLQYGFDSAFRPSQTQVLHEPLIDEDPVFIATCTERELRKRKKRKFSLWVRQCSSTGFISQIYVHLKEGGGADGLDTLKNKPQLHSMVAKSLCRNAAGKNYIIFTGPSITSLPLFEEFEKQEIYCCGLLSSRKSDCTGLPLSMLNNSDFPQVRGRYRIKMKGNTSLICWYNKGPFRFLTNAYSPVQQGVIIKRKSGEIPCPLAVEAFAAHLSYICRYDDKYSKYFISHKPNKTWQQVFWFAISIAINNAYILYKMSEAYHVKRYSRAQFGERLVKELLGLEDTSPSH